MTKIEKLTKRVVEVDTMLWDGTDEAAEAIKAWVGHRLVFVPPDRMVPAEPCFLLPSEISGVSEHAQLFVKHNDSWSPLPVGYRVARELDGSGFYPLSPEGATAGYEMDKQAGQKAPDGAPWYAHRDGPCGPECANGR